MRESQIQSAVTDKILERESDNVTVGVKDNELIILIFVDEMNAAYTADEARLLADAIERSSQNQEKTKSKALVGYLRDCAEVVDNNKDCKVVREEWEANKKDYTY